MCLAGQSSDAAMMRFIVQMLSVKQRKTRWTAVGIKTENIVTQERFNIQKIRSLFSAAL